jgi:hypothetical protein
VARAKIESKKHFDLLPNATDAEQQIWIEEKIRLDFTRLLDRLAAQLNSEIVGIPIFQIGFVDYHFNKTTNPSMADVDEETLSAARMICYVLPALSESVVSYQHQSAANALVDALVKGAPPQDQFIAAVFMLAQDPQLLLGLEKLLSNIFLPKTGSQLSQLRKRADPASDAAAGETGLTASSSAPAPIYHWKEPATIANSVRYSTYAARAPAPIHGGFANTVVQPYYQDPLPPPILVQAEIYRPPPPPTGYYQQPYMPNQPQGYYQNGYYPGPPTNSAPPSNWVNQGNHDGQTHGYWPSTSPYGQHLASYQRPPDGYRQNYQQSSHQTPTNGHAGYYQQPRYAPSPPDAPAVNYQAPSQAPPSFEQRPPDIEGETSPGETNEGGYQQLLNDVKDLPLPGHKSAPSSISSPRISESVSSAKVSGARTTPTPPTTPLPLVENRHTSEDMPALSTRSSRQTRNDISPPRTVVTSREASNGNLQKPLPSSRTKSKQTPQENEATTTPAKACIISDRAPQEKFRRRSSRGTVLTLKAKAAGIMLGTQARDTDQASSEKIPKPAKTRRVSTPPEVNDAPPLVTSASPCDELNIPELAEPRATNGNGVLSTELPETPTSFVPRSSGRERKPTAKSLASSSLRSVIRAPDYASSIPRVSSKLRLSLSSQGSILSAKSVGSESSLNETILTPSSKGPTSPDGFESLAASVIAHDSSRSRVSRQSDGLGHSKAPELDKRRPSDNERRTSAAERSPSVVDLTRTTFSDDETSPEKDDNQPLIGTNVTSAAANLPNRRSFVNQNFLTNDKGQDMGQALLMMARVAAEWSDSDEGDNTEIEFQAHLQQAVDKQMQQSKIDSQSKTPSQVPRQSTCPLSQPGIGVPAVIQRPVRSQSGSSSNVPIGIRSGPAPPPVAFHTTGPQNGIKSANADPRSISQITDDFIALVKLKDEAKKLGLVIDDWMSLEELTNFVQAYHISRVDVVSKSGMGVLVPSPASTPTNLRAAVNGHAATRGAHVHMNGMTHDTPATGATDFIRSSTPSTRAASSTTPQPRVQTPPIPITFKKGGTVMNFRAKAKQAAAAASPTAT